MSASFRFLLTLLFGLLLCPAPALSSDWLTTRLPDGVTVSHPAGWSVQRTEEALLVVGPSGGELVILGVMDSAAAGGPEGVAEALLDNLRGAAVSFRETGRWRAPRGHLFAEAAGAGNDGQVSRVQVLVVTPGTMSAYGVYVGPEAGYARETKSRLLERMVMSIGTRDASAGAGSVSARGAGPAPAGGAGSRPAPSPAGGGQVTTHPLGGMLRRGETIRSPARRFVLQVPAGWTADDAFSVIEVSREGDDGSRFTVRFANHFSIEEIEATLSRPVPVAQAQGGSRRQQDASSGCVFQPMGLRRERIDGRHVLIADGLHRHGGTEQYLRTVVVMGGHTAVTVQLVADSRQAFDTLRAAADSVARSVGFISGSPPPRSAMQSLAGVHTRIWSRGRIGITATHSSGRVTLRLCADGTGGRSNSRTGGATINEFYYGVDRDQAGRWFVEEGDARRGRLWVIDGDGKGIVYDYDLTGRHPHFNGQEWRREGSC